MKTRYGKILHSCAIALFSLSLVGSAYGDAATITVYENMIATALAKPAVNDKIDALNGITSAMGSIDAETAKEINPEFTAALTSVYTAGQKDAVARIALHKLLGNALQSTVLSPEQQATVTQWRNSLGIETPAAAQAPISQPKALDANTMQQLATAGAGIKDRIAALEKEEDTGKALEGVYNLLQDSQNQSFNSDVQERFGRLVVKVFNDGSEVTAYLHQVLHDIVDSKTPLLAPAQIDYVSKEMLPRVDGGDAAAHTETHATAKETETGAPATNKNAKKDKKKIKKNKDAKSGKARKKEKKAGPEHAAEAEAKEATPAADAGHANNAGKKEKKDTGKTNKKIKKAKKSNKGAAHSNPASGGHAGKTNKKIKKAKKSLKGGAHAQAAQASPEEDNAPVVTE
jgi:hypothetical protein